MIKIGTLSENLILAHASVRNIKQVFVLGRDFEKAKTICGKMKDKNFSIETVKTIEEKISEVNIIFSATLSKSPLVLGKYLKPGQYVDLVGAYKKDMREADDDTIRKSLVYIDAFHGGLKESGDIAMPLKK